MRALIATLALVILCSAERADSDDNRAKKQLRSGNYTVTWAVPAAYEPSAELEIGQGNGHAGNLNWLRFRPDKDGVNVLSIKLNEGLSPYKSKWPPDRARVTIQRARLNSRAYIALLRDLAIVDSAKLKRVERTEFTSSSNSFWVAARLTTKKKTLLELDWAGFTGSSCEPDYAKPRAAVCLAHETLKRIDFADHTLTKGERAWASAKFARDWTKFKGLKSNWWVRERYIETIGMVGDKAAIPVLRDILATDPPKGKPREASDGRCVYYAINAVTRLTNKDVRSRPVEEMDIE